MPDYKKNKNSSLIRKNQDILFDELKLHLQLEDELQKQNIGKLFIKAMSAISELKSNEKILEKMCVDTYNSFNAHLQNELLVKESKLDSEECLNEILNGYVEVTEAATKNLEVYKNNQQFFHEEIEVLRSAKHSELASQIGSKKNERQRNAAYKHLRYLLNIQPELSINRLASILEVDSEKDHSIFGRKIPFSTGKDYARTIKKEVESSSQ